MDTPIKTMRIANPNGEGFLTINADEFDPSVHKPYGTKAEKAAATGGGDPHKKATQVAGADVGERVNPAPPDPDRADEKPPTPPVVDTGFNVGKLVETDEGARKPANLQEAEALKRASDPTAAQAKELLEKAAKEDTSIVDMSAADATEWIAKQSDKAVLKKALHAEQKHERYEGGRKAVTAALTTKIDSL
jgi:hypothetical protein